MSAVRFNTVRDLYDAFETAAAEVGEPAADKQSIEFLRDLARAKKWKAAISFCAYLLPRRAAVAWACQAVRRAISRPAAEDDKALHFAEAWVREPEDLQRRKALAFGSQASPKLATTWLALAAGWSGGNVVLGDTGYAPAPPEQTARAVRVALYITETQLPEGTAEAILTAWIEDGMRLARGESSPP